MDAAKRNRSKHSQAVYSKKAKSSNPTKETPKGVQNMNKLIIDYETYWGAGFTLRSTPIQEYVTDERFEVLSVSYQICSPQGELLNRVDLGGSHVEEHMELF